jgi:hypothetical protein
MTGPTDTSTSAPTEVLEAIPDAAETAALAAVVPPPRERPVETVAISPAGGPVQRVVPPSTMTASPIRGVAAVVVALALAVVVPIVFVDWTRNSGTALNTVLCLVLIAISTWRITEVIALGRRAVLRSMFYVFVYVFLAMPALAQSVSGIYPLDGLSYAEPTVTQGLVHVLVGVLAYEAGWALVGLRRRRDVGVQRAEGPTPWFAFSKVRSVLLGGIGLGFTAYLVARDGVVTYFTSRADTTAALTGSEAGGQFYAADDKTSGLLTIFLSQFLVFVALFAILYSRKHRLWVPAALVPDALWRAFIAVLIVANLIMNNPLGNGRWWFCLVAVAFASIYLPIGERNNERLYVVGALVLLFFSFASLDAFRYAGSTVEVAGPSRTLVDNDTYAMFQMELNGVRYVEDNGHTEGLQMLGSALGFVPRSVWPDKPIPTGQVVDPQYARSATAWTEAQVDFGLTGVVVFFLLYGAGSRVLSARFRRSSPGMLHATVPVFAALQIFLLRGSLMPAVGSLDQLIFAFAVLASRHPLRREEGA